MKTAITSSQYSHNAANNHIRLDESRELFLASRDGEDHLFTKENHQTSRHPLSYNSRDSSVRPKGSVDCAKRQMNKVTDNTQLCAINTRDYPDTYSPAHRKTFCERWCGKYDCHVRCSMYQQQERTGRTE